MIEKFFLRKPQLYINKNQSNQSEFPRRAEDQFLYLNQNVGARSHEVIRVVVKGCVVWVTVGHARTNTIVFWAHPLPIDAFAANNVCGTWNIDVM